MRPTRHRRKASRFPKTLELSTAKPYKFHVVTGIVGNGIAWFMCSASHGVYAITPIFSSSASCVLLNAASSGLNSFLHLSTFDNWPFAVSSSYLLACRNLWSSRSSMTESSSSAPPLSFVRSLAVQFRMCCLYLMILGGSLSSAMHSCSFSCSGLDHACRVGYEDLCLL